MPGETGSKTSGLTLALMTHPASQQKVNVFENPRAAQAHVRDHVLSHPESEAWRLVWPALNNVADFQSADEIWALLKQAEQDADASLQPIYDEYAKAIRAEVSDALTLGWMDSENRTTVCLGTGGVVSLFEPVLRTAMLPGFGSPHRTQRSREQATAVSHMFRHQPMRAVRRSRTACNRSPDALRRLQHREQRWSGEQRLYFRVFRPVVQSVRREYHRSLDIYGQPRRRDVAMLKNVLPRQRQLKFPCWQELRRRCRGH